MLEVKNLTKIYEGDVKALDNVSFSVKPGEFLAVIGLSGSGKSTLLRCINRLVEPTEGQILWNGIDITAANQSEMRLIRRKIGMVFQDPISTLNPIMTIGEQISETITRHLRVSKEEARDRTIKILAQVGIPDPELRYKSYPFQFSGGMRQRVVIAIAIACSPQIIIADEPTTALDVTVQAQIVDLFKRLSEALNAAVIWITHDLGVVAGIADRVLVMYGGRAAEIAKVDDLYERPQHPYTFGLLGALPKLDSQESKRLVSIRGTPPDLLIPLKHCPFAWRCDYAYDRCWEEIPPQIEVTPKHQVSCFYNLEKGEPRDF